MLCVQLYEVLKLVLFTYYDEAGVENPGPDVRS